MEFLQSELVKFQSDTLETVRKNYGFNSPRDINNAIDILEEWIQKQNHFVRKDYDRKYLEVALIMNKGSVERAKKKLDRLCTFRTLMPQFFGAFDIKKDAKEFDDYLKQVVCPRLTKEHDRVAILKNCGKKFENTLMLTYFRMTIASLEYMKTCDYARSYILIIDYRGVNFADLAMKFNLVDLQQGMTILTEAYSVRVKALHIISPSKMVETIVRLLKQVLSDKIGSRIMVHKDLESVYEHVSKEILPKDYGGDEKSLDEIYDELVEIIGQEKFIAYLKEMGEARTDESRRQKDSFNQDYMGMPGTFRTLSVD